MTAPAVELKGVVKTYPNGVSALKGVSLTFHKGEVTAILGPSGAGKSTLLRLINGLEAPTEGEVWVGGCRVEPRTLRQVRRKTGMVFQQFNLVPRLSVMANVACGRLGFRGLLTSLFFVFPESDLALARQALERVGLKGREWDRVDRLSGGQQQRVAIARTLVQQCDFVLADEPVASLDPATGDEVMELLASTARDSQAGLILNLHQVDLARRFAHRIIGLRRGEPVFDLPVSEVADSRLSELYLS